MKQRGVEVTNRFKNNKEQNTRVFPHLLFILCVVIRNNMTLKTPYLIKKN